MAPSLEIIAAHHATLWRRASTPCYARRMFILRPARIGDWARLLAWRNDPGTRAQSKSPDRVGLNEHMAWLRATLAKKTVFLYVAEDAAQSRVVGTGRLDLDAKKNVAELSLTVDPRYRGAGYAIKIVSELVARATIDAPGAALVATVLTDNEPSLRAFAANGFLPAREKDGLVLLSRQPADRP